MFSELSKKLGIEHAIFAFSHCRDVVAAVSNSGGMGVLGAGWFSPEQLAEELNWLDNHVKGIYGVDVVIPQKYEGMEEIDPDALEDRLWKQIPNEHIDFANKLLSDQGVPEWPKDMPHTEPTLPGATYATALPLIQEALTRPKCKVIVNALGTPPDDVIKMVHNSGRLIGALCGKVKQAIAHKDAGLDFVVAQGSEGGGHTGEIGSIVLWPQIADAITPLPMLAAGGIGNGRQMLAAMSSGAAGVWTGSLWLTVEEATSQPAQKESYLNATSEDTVRSRAWTGKPARLIKNQWTDLWDDVSTPKPLGMPMQFMVSADARRRTERYAGIAKTQAVAMNPAGQVIGQFNQVESCRAVMYRLLTEYADTLERLNKLVPDR
ncbi:MAG TPA: nitronate monooxygenase [Gammaproteobacteria bacterium]|nr:nitronate monooxygenase [Gammaproteobacteria bacterium]